MVAAAGQSQSPPNPALTEPGARPGCQALHRGSTKGSQGIGQEGSQGIRQGKQRGSHTFLSLLFFSLLLGEIEGYVGNGVMLAMILRSVGDGLLMSEGARMVMIYGFKLLPLFLYSSPTSSIRQGDEDLIP